MPLPATQVKLGLIPATISPYVVRRIGAAQARRYFLTAETIKSDVAQQIGLVHEVVKSADDLAELEAHFKRHILNNSPAGIKASKELIDAVAGQPITSELIGTTQQAWVRGGGVGCSRSLGVLCTVLCACEQRTRLCVCATHVRLKRASRDSLPSLRSGRRRGFREALPACD